MKLSRRTLLRGTGATLALPLLECMLNAHGTALAQGAPLPKRFVVWFFGNGVRLSTWNPAATGSGNAWQLSSALAPLANVKSSLSVVTGMEVKTPDLRGHHNGLAAMLSGAPFIPIPANGASYASKFGMKSIDQVVADVIGKGTTFPSLQLQVSKRVSTSEGPTLFNLSHRSPDQPLPAETSPAAVYARLFGNFQGGQATADARNTLRTSVLDAVREDATRLNARLGAADKSRLDAHLNSVSELRQQIMALPPAASAICTKPAAITETNADVGGVEQLDRVNAAMSDLMAYAMACDLTRVATLMFSGSVGYHTYKALDNGAARTTEHDMTHDAANQQKVHDAVVYTMRNLAYTLERLQKTPDGTTNLLDSSAVLVTSDLTEGLSHSRDDYPILVAGKARGALKTDQHYRSTTKGNTSDVLLACMQAVGAGVTSVGKDEGLSTTPLRALLA